MASTEPSGLTEPVDDSDLDDEEIPCTDDDDSRWEAFIPDDDECDPEPDAGRLLDRELSGVGVESREPESSARVTATVQVAAFRLARILVREGRTMLALSVVEEIDRLLDEGELSQRKIAARLGVSRGTVGGDRQRPAWACMAASRTRTSRDPLVPLGTAGAVSAVRLSGLHAVPGLPHARVSAAAAGRTAAGRVGGCEATAEAAPCPAPSSERFIAAIDGGMPGSRRAGSGTWQIAGFDGAHRPGTIAGHHESVVAAGAAVERPHGGRYT